MNTDKIESAETENESEATQPTPWYFYVLSLLFCIVMVLCITFLSYKMNCKWLMFFYVLPVFCFCGL